MKQLHKNYCEEYLGQIESQRLDANALASYCRKYRWNYRRFFDGLARDANILDVGCGFGQFLYYLKTTGFENVHGIDLADVTGRVRELLPGVDVRQEDDVTGFLRQHAAEYDVIVLNDVLEHIPLDDMVDFVLAIHGALKPGGMVIIKTPNSSFPLGYFARYGDLTHTTAFHENSLGHLLRHCGFNDIRCYQEEIGVYNPLFAAKKLVVVLVRFLLRTLVYFAEGGWQRILSVNIICAARKPLVAGPAGND
jgi:2-polyprenyl-3-methyl-5-hydroxy-6-metoxy-1,4-benzoquinol methylase